MSFVQSVAMDFEPDMENAIFPSLMQQYERVIVQSIITSFGLDFLIRDRHGGDVDTIHNVREIGKDPLMEYKNKSNEITYENRGDYNGIEYHSDPGFRKIKHDARAEFDKNGVPLKDEYSGEDLFFRHRDTDKNANLDHVISAKEIHDDRARVLSGIKGTDLANSRENLKFTSEHLNKSMGEDSIEEYIVKHPELDEKTKNNMLRSDKAARKAYNAKLNGAYYTSRNFINDMGSAAVTVGMKMGIRQTLGLFFTEIWFSIKEEFSKLSRASLDLYDIFTSIGHGIKCGFENAKAKYKELFSQFLTGAIGGFFSSITTTLCNIFFTTAKNVVKIIRQSWASLTEALKILFLNPDNLLFGERCRAVLKVIATGASVIVGTLVSEAVGDIGGIKALPFELGIVVQTFCGTFVSGIMSCSLLYFMDSNPLVDKLVAFLNKIPTIETAIQYYKQQAELFRRYAAQLMDIDLEKFRKETEFYSSLADELDSAISEYEFNAVLKRRIRELNLVLPWGNDFESFMCNKNSRMVFN